MSQSTPLLGSVVTHEFGTLENSSDALRDVFLAGLKTINFPRQVRRELSTKAGKMGFLYVVAHPEPNQCSIILKDFEVNVPKEVNLKKEILVEVIITSKPLKANGDECARFWYCLSRADFKDWGNQSDQVDETIGNKLKTRSLSSTKRVPLLRLIGKFTRKSPGQKTMEIEAKEEVEKKCD
jgi:hypothetical protein